MRPRWKAAISGVAIFIGLVTLGELQVRNNAQWPPPIHHEVGDWRVENPASLDGALLLNLPASIPILLLAQESDGFAAALDDHNLLVYVPWIIFVAGLWYSVGSHIELYLGRGTGTSVWKTSFLAAFQIVISIEMVALIVPEPRQTMGIRVLTPLVVWSVGTILGWINLFGSTRVRLSSMREPADS